jgi:flagellar motor switch protein FliM
MAVKDQVDQDALAAEWGVALEAEHQTDAGNGAAAAPAEGDAEAMAAQWASMVDDGQFIQAAKGGAERILTQEEIDSLLGFSLAEVNLNDNSGIRAIIDSAMVSYERLPMLEIVFDRLVRLMTTSLRNFTSDNVEISLDRITSVRFGDYLNSIPLPAILGVFKAEEWDNFGMITVNSSLIYSIIDVLLGGRRGQTAIRIEGRPYTTIEANLIKRMIEVCRDLTARQCGDPGAAARRYGRPRRHHRTAVALRHHRADPRRAVADVHGREIRPQPDLGGASRDRNRTGGNCSRCSAL